MRLRHAVLLALVAGGCAATRPPPLPAEPAFDPQRATVYFFRRHGLSAIGSSVATRDRAVDARLEPGSYVVHQAPPGALEVTASTSHNQYAQHVLQLAAGSTYYVEVQVFMSAVNVGLVDERLGRSFITSVKQSR